MLRCSVLLFWHLWLDASGTLTSPFRCCMCKGICVRVAPVFSVAGCCFLVEVVSLWKWWHCALTVENRSLDNLPDQQHLGTVSVRIMVHEWPLASTSDLQLIVIQEEVTEIDGKQVKKKPCYNILLVFNLGETSSSQGLQDLHVSGWWLEHKVYT